MTGLSRLMSLAAGIVLMLLADHSSADQPLVLVSSFVPGDQGGIQTFHLDTTSGILTPVHRTSGVENPFFIAVSPDQKFLYSIHAPTFGGKEPEQVAAYRLEGLSGKMTLLNRQSTQGTASC